MADKLITVPNIVFTQDTEEGGVEHPITICYYIGSIELRQNENQILLMPELAKQFCKDLLKHLPEAEEWYEKRNKE